MAITDLTEIMTLKVKVQGHGKGPLVYQGTIIY